MTTPLVISVTDELVAELERSVECVWPETDLAVVTLRALLSERAELIRDARRYRWLIRQAWFQSAMDRYDIDDGGWQARFEAETARIIDAAMQSEANP